MISHWIHNALIFIEQNPHYGYFFAFIVSFLESLPIVGTIIPGSVTMTAVGTLIGTDVLPLFTTMFSAVIGAFFGDFIGFLVGRLGEDRIFNIWPFNRNKKWLIYGRDFFNKHGIKSVIIGRFIGPIRSAIPMLASILGMTYAKFVVAGICSAILWAILYITPGIILGHFSLDINKKEMATWITFIIIALIIFLLVYGLFKLACKLYQKHYAIRIQAYYENLVAKTSLWRALSIKSAPTNPLPLFFAIWFAWLGCLLALTIWLHHQFSWPHIIPNLSTKFMQNHLCSNFLSIVQNNTLLTFVYMLTLLNLFTMINVKKALMVCFTNIAIFLVGISLLFHYAPHLSTLVVENIVLWTPLYMFSVICCTHYKNAIVPSYVCIGIITIIINIWTILLLGQFVYSMILSWLLAGMFITLTSMMTIGIRWQTPLFKLDSVYALIPTVVGLSLFLSAICL